MLFLSNTFFRITWKLSKVSQVAHILPFAQVESNERKEKVYFFTIIQLISFSNVCIFVGRLKFFKYSPDNVLFIKDIYSKQNTENELNSFFLLFKQSMK